ncbi:MAG: pilus assembly protein [Nitrospinae bacterium CG11_big_fil_rev_8_21_14_0_20_56_8]|nr:MAG: pilus assembly protein [Nitrospinae bacterium CG11_big_fil_rev_8_21_14_0_20_56_8]
MAGGLRREKGFTLIELLIVIAIIGILAAIAVPQFSQYKKRGYDTDAKSNLHNLYLACKAYWADNGAMNPCQVSVATQASYGFVQGSSVSLTPAGLFEDNFGAQAKHGSSSNTFDIDSSGNISMQ